MQRRRFLDMDGRYVRGRAFNLSLPATRLLSLPATACAALASPCRRRLSGGRRWT